MQMWLSELLAELWAGQLGRTRPILMSASSLLEMYSSPPSYCGPRSSQQSQQLGTRLINFCPGVSPAGECCKPLAVINILNNLQEYVMDVERDNRSSFLKWKRVFLPPWALHPSPGHSSAPSSELSNGNSFFFPVRYMIFLLFWNVGTTVDICG